MTKQQAYEKATLENIGNNPNGTRMDVIYLAMGIYAEAYAEEKVKEICNFCGKPVSQHARSVTGHTICYPTKTS